MITVRRRTIPAHRTAIATRLAGWPRGALLALVLGAFAAACQDATSPMGGLKPQFAQGDDGVWTVNSLADPGDGVCDDTACTLREAIATATSGGTITFAPEVTGTITLTAGQLVIDKALKIVGPNELVIDAQGLSRVFLIDDQMVADIPVEISGLSMSGGSVSLSGGGAFNVETLTLRDVLVINNRADYDGAGIFNVGSLTLLNTTVSNNVASEHGGGIASITDDFTLAGSTVTGNTGVMGGGIFQDAGQLTVVNSTISGNSAAFLGNGIYKKADVMITLNSTIIDRIHITEALASFGNSVVGECVGENVIGMQSLGHNLLVGCIEVTPAATDIVLASPQLGDVLDPELKDNGGPTETHALIVDGPAVDAGKCDGQPTDQRGFPRPVDYPGVDNVDTGCDIGAYELQVPFVPVADLMVSQAVDKTSVKQGQLLTYSIRVQNLGPQTAPNVVMNDVLSSGVTFVEARGGGTFTAPNKGETGTVTWYLGDMIDQGDEVAELEVTVLVKGKTTITNTATVTGGVADPNVANNTASITVSVGAGGGGGGGGKKK